MNPNLLSWNIEENSMIIKIKYNDKVIMNIFVGEAMEIIGRKETMKHVTEIENTPWIKNWHKEI
jgi:hypothetical protein